MSQLGSIPFTGHHLPYDSAAAFLLTRPSKLHEVVPCSEGEVEVHPDTGYVVARFAKAADAAMARGSGLELVQEGLDILSILGKEDLATQRAGEECLVAWRDGPRQIIRICSTSTLSFSVPPVRVQVTDASGEVHTREPTPPIYNAAFRYFRLSQISSDLHEAFRNMYLCFEMLLSSKYPLEDGERERAWLERGLSLTHDDLDLSRFVKDSGPNVVDHVISTVYTAARLPLFHAKADRHVVAPHSVGSEAEPVLGALKMLTGIVLAMAEKWFGARRMGGGVFSGWVYRNFRDVCSEARVLAMRDAVAFDPTQSDLKAERYETAVPMATEVCGSPDDPRVPVLAGEVMVSALWQGTLVNIEVVDLDKPLLAHALASPLSLEGFDVLQYYDVPAVVNRNQPKMRFST